jgi:prolyl 4-hydroxylase
MGKLIQWIIEHGLDTLVIVCIGVVIWMIYRYYTNPVAHSCTTCSRKKEEPELEFLVDLPIQLRVPSPGSYRVVEYPHFLSDQLCDLLIESAGPYLETSGVYNGLKIEHTSTKHTSRISKNATVRNNITERVADQVADWTRIPREYQEYIQVIKYDEQGVFDFHYDTIPANRSIPSWSRMITVMVYLNGGETDSPELLGGETEFPAIDKIIKPEKGKAVLFWSVRPSAKGSELIKESLHKGAVVKSGEKWICNIWIHSQPFLVDARYR